MEEDNLKPEEKIKTKENESKMSLTFVFLFLVFMGIDQLTKIWAARIFKNVNFAFSIPLPVVAMFAIYFIVLAMIFYYVFKHNREFSKITTLAWTLIFAGAICNIVERIILGYVRDWIYITSGIFNLADVYIIAGVVILLFSKKKSH